MSAQKDEAYSPNDEQQPMLESGDEEGDDEQHQRGRASSSTTGRAAAAKRKATDLTGSNSDDDKKPAAAAAAAASKPPPGTPNKRLTKWSNKEDLELCSSVQTYVTDHQGMLPGPVKTTKGAAVSKEWKEIAKSVSKVMGQTEDAAAKACSSRWTKVRGDLKVRENEQTRASDEQKARTRTVAHSCSLCVVMSRTTSTPSAMLSRSSCRKRIQRQ
jgi:hypothetical protein